MTAQNALAVAREAALAVLAKIVGSGADLRAKLNAAVAHRLDAQNLAAAADKVSHHAAIVAYAAYAADRTALMTEKAADLDGAKLKKEWEDAADAWLAAEVAVAAADEDVIKQQLEVDMQLADQAAQLKTRDAAATAAVTVAIP